MVNNIYNYSENKYKVVIITLLSFYIQPKFSHLPKLIWWHKLNRIYFELKNLYLHNNKEHTARALHTNEYMDKTQRPNSRAENCTRNIPLIKKSCQILEVVMCSPVMRVSFRSFFGMIEYMTWPHAFRGLYRNTQDQIVAMSRHAKFNQWNKFGVHFLL